MSRTRAGRRNTGRGKPKAATSNKSSRAYATLVLAVIASWCSEVLVRRPRRGTAMICALCRLQLHVIEAKSSRFWMLGF